MKVPSLLLLACLILGGCANVRSKQPVGEEPLDLSVSKGDRDLEGIAGEWVSADGEVSVITVEDAEKGMVVYAPRNPGEDGKPVKVELRRTGDDVFANFEPDEDGEGPNEGDAEAGGEGSGPGKGAAGDQDGK